MSPHGKHKGFADLHCQEWRNKGRKNSPNDQCMPFPLPQQSQKLHRVPMTEMQDLRPIHRQAVGMEYGNPSIDKGKEKQPLQGGNKVYPDLRCQMVQLEKPRQKQHADCGDTQKRVDPDH